MKNPFKGKSVWSIISGVAGVLGMVCTVAKFFADPKVEKEDQLETIRNEVNKALDERKES